MKIKIGQNNYEKTKIVCGIMTDYYDVMEVVSESEKVNGFTTKKDFQLIKEFLVNFFDNQFTTEDIDKELDTCDLMVFWSMIGQEVQDKTKSKLEKILKK